MELASTFGHEKIDTDGQWNTLGPQLSPVTFFLHSTNTFRGIGRGFEPIDDTDMNIKTENMTGASNNDQGR